MQAMAVVTVLTPGCKGIEIAGCPHLSVLVHVGYEESSSPNCKSTDIQFISEQSLLAISA
jgi:hypothetical protein